MLTADEAAISQHERGQSSARKSIYTKYNIYGGSLYQHTHPPQILVTMGGGLNGKLIATLSRNSF